MDPDDLIEALRKRLPGARRHRALALAHPRTTSERAWQLVALGISLRHAREYQRSLEALDAAVSLAPHPRVVRAAYFCAIEVHRDRGDYEAALRISRSIPE